MTAALPYSDNGWLQDLEIENRPAIPGKFQSALHLAVSQGYFDALHIPIVAGRGFTQSDSFDSLPVAVVSERFVARYFPSPESAWAIAFGWAVRTAMTHGSQSSASPGDELLHVGCRRSNPRST